MNSIPHPKQTTVPQRPPIPVDAISPPDEAAGDQVRGFFYDARRALTAGDYLLRKWLPILGPDLFTQMGHSSPALEAGDEWPFLIVAVSPAFTTQDCSGCGERVKKTLSMRTHICPSCGLVLDRDWNAALNILAAALAWLAAHRTAGQAETGSRKAANASRQTTAGGRTRVRAAKLAG